MTNVEEFLAHHGVKGMRWGVINEDAEKKYKKKTGEAIKETVGNIFGKKSASQEAVERGEKMALDDRNRINASLMSYGKGNGAADRLAIQNCESLLKQINETLILHNNYDSARISEEDRSRAVSNFNYLVDNFEKKFEVPIEEHSIYKALVATNDAYSDMIRDYEAEKGMTPVISEETNPELYALSKSYELLNDQLIKEVCEASGWPSDNKDINNKMKQMLTMVELLPEKGKKTSGLAHSGFFSDADDFLAHYGKKGMKWGIINERQDEKLNEKHGKVYDTINKVGAALGSDKAKGNVAAKEQKAAADRGIKNAEHQHNVFFGRLDYYKDPAVKQDIIETHLWEMRGKMSHENMVNYQQGDVDAVEKIYQAAKLFDLLMNQYAENSGTSLDDDKTIGSMQKDSEELDDLYNKLKDEGVRYPEEDPAYAKKLEEVESNLDKYADHVATTLGFPNEDKESYERIKNDLKVLWFNTGYTNVAGHDNSDWSQYGRRDERREERKKEKESSIRHSEILDLPYLSHHGIKGMKWGVRRYQNYDGTLINPKRKDSSPHKVYDEYESGTKNYKKRDATHLSDDELKKRVNRLTQENNYRQQLKIAQEAGMSKRKRLVNKIFVESAQNAAASVMQKVYTNSATAFLKNQFPALMDDGSKKKKS